MNCASQPYLSFVQSDTSTDNSVNTSRQTTAILRANPYLISFFALIFHATR